MPLYEAAGPQELTQRLRCSQARHWNTR